MPRKNRQERLADKHRSLIAEFDRVQTAMRDERLQCLKDRRFYSIAGAQWEGDLADQFAKRVKFEMNKIHLSIIRIFSEYRNNRIDVLFTPSERNEDDGLADTCNGLYRADEKDSSAQEAYDNGFEEAIGGGFGAWRLTTCYVDEEDDDDDRQRVAFEPIFDADSCVFFDLDAKKQDKSDARRCWVMTAMTPDAYREAYGRDPAGMQRMVTQVEFDWFTPDLVYVAEAYEVEEQRYSRFVWEPLLEGAEPVTITSMDLNADPTLPKQLRAKGFTQTAEKKVTRKRVRKYIMDGAEILEDCGQLPGRYIPIIPMFAKRWFVDGVERCMGHGRLATDAQRLKNMQISKLGEIAAKSPTEKPIFTPEQMLGHTSMWANDAVEDYPYLLVNPVKDANGNKTVAGAIGYTKSPDLPPVLAALLQLTETDMQDLLGSQQATEKVTPNVAAETVELIQNRLDMQTYIYMSNMAKAVQHTGRVWLSMARDILVEEGRRMKTVGSQGEVGYEELYRPEVDEETGQVVTRNDVGSADLDVDVEVGPSSTTRRASTVKALTSMASLTDDPETKQVLGAMAMMNMEGEGVTEARDWFRKKLLRLGVVKPTREEAQALAQEQQNQQPDPQAQFLQASAEQALADATEKRSKVVLNLSNASKAQAEAAKTASEVGTVHTQQAVDALAKLAPSPDATAPRAPA